jgi:hypothetical protein
LTRTLVHYGDSGTCADLSHQFHRELTQDERDELERPFVGEVDFNPPRIEDMLQFEGIHGATELRSDFANEDVYDDAEYSVLSRFG